MNKNKILVLFVLLFNLSGVLAQQEYVADRVVAIIGDKIILQSDIENQALQMRAQNYTARGDIKCEVLEQLMVQKLLLIQAELDSLVVSENQIAAEIDRRIMYFVRQIGSEEKLEEYYNKSIPEIKNDFYPLIREQILTQQMQSQLVSSIEVSPNNVEEFYNSIPEDSIPMINAEMQIGQIVMYPPRSEQAKIDAREELLNLRKRILEGERFSTLAVLYSEDKASARRGGELGFLSKQELDPAFATEAFSLKEGQVSGIVESDFGMHIIQMIGREGDQVNVRHILVQPKIDIELKIKTINKLDSIARLIRQDSINFATAARKFSEDNKSKYNDGLMINPNDNSVNFTLDQLSREEYLVINELKLGEISDAFEAKDQNGKEVYKIVKIIKRSEPHRANLKSDYQLLEQMCIQSRQNTTIRNWVDKKQKTTYIHIDDSFINCNFNDDGWIK